MSQHQPASVDLSRRAALAGSLLAFVLPTRVNAQSKSAPAADPACPRCSGLGRIPLKDARSWVWVEPAPPPKAQALLGEQFCPLCQASADPAALAAEAQDHFTAALESHHRWEDRTGWKLVCAVTRHATLHSQLSSTQTKAAATALEALTLHLKRVTDSMALSTTRPDTFELMLLLEKPSWDAFRKIMEHLYTPAQLGEAWPAARDLHAYDHIAVPHLYETAQSMRTRSPSCAITFITARRQLSRATDWKAPFWLAEGFAAYGDYVVHKLNRWFTTYAGEAVPPGDWLARARKLVADAQERPWPDLFRLELRDWEPRDHFQSMAIAAFLLEAEPAKFLHYLHQVAGGESHQEALSTSFGASTTALEERWQTWLLTRR